ncbi:flagellar biosynthesis protein FlhF [Onishia niordana]|uniref:flagellar biosynthesis protein FlhF n=1 Tax=Onishia niordana TaxID=2508711 RepID=UPI00109F3D29|nr:flagellar biosynthesis protein FlhF [Halomonas niordiana]
MSVKRFLGANSREAMRQVRAVFGDDALILANRPVEDGVEILAMADDAADPVVGESGSANEAVSIADETSPVARPAGQTATRPSSSSGSEADQAWRVAHRASSGRAQSTAQPTVTRPPAPAESQAPATPSAAQDFAALSQQLLGEMQEMRELLGKQDRPKPSSSSDMRRRLLASGFGHELVGDLLASLPTDLAGASSEDEQAWLERQLVARLKVAPEAEAMLDEGGVIALVGPTGVGKTTTTAKLAARYVMRHGPERAVLVTTDAYRIGAQDQLRIYADLMGIEMHALEADRPLESLLPRLVDKHLVIVDTVGMSQRDRRLLEQIAHLRGDSRAVRLVLLLNAASQGETIDEVVTTYLQAARAVDGRLEDAILTKHDEAARLGGALDTLIRHGLTLHFVSHGQQVPEDLGLADSVALIREALEAGVPSPFAATQVDEPQAGASRGAPALLGQGRALGSIWEMLRAHVPGFGMLSDAWAISSLPPSLHPVRLTSLHERMPAQGTTLLWARSSTLPGEDWMLPHLALDSDGRPVVQPFPEHRLVAGHRERIDWAESAIGVSAHLLPRVPDAATRDWLRERGSGWLSQAQGNSRVLYRGERSSLSSLVDEARAIEPALIRYRGQAAKVMLGRLEALSCGAGDAHSDALWVWFADVRDRDSGALLSRRYALSPEWWPTECGRAALLEQLCNDELPTLARQASRQLCGQGPLALDSELRVFMATGIAALALHLEHAEEDWAMDARANLMRLQSGRRPRRAKNLLEGLIQVLDAREAIRHFSEQAGRSQ